MVFYNISVPIEHNNNVEIVQFVGNINNTQILMNYFVNSKRGQQVLCGIQSRFLIAFGNVPLMKYSVIDILLEP